MTEEYKRQTLHLQVLLVSRLCSHFFVLGFFVRPFLGLTLFSQSFHSVF